jgi:hypothetical protein
LLTTSALRRERVRDDDEWLDVLSPVERRAWDSVEEEELPDHVASGVNLDVPLEPEPAAPRRRPRPGPRPHR